MLLFSILLTETCVARGQGPVVGDAWAGGFKPADRQKNPDYSRFYFNSSILT